MYGGGGVSWLVLPPVTCVSFEQHARGNAWEKFSLVFLFTHSREKNVKVFQNCSSSPLGTSSLCVSLISDCPCMSCVCVDSPFVAGCLAVETDGIAALKQRCLWCHPSQPSLLVAPVDNVAQSHRSRSPVSPVPCCWCSG